MAKLTKKQQLMIESLKSNACNISQACKSANISRQTHYDWIDKSDNYKKEYNDVVESLIDFAESALMRQIKEGIVPSTIFFLKTRGKSRGYVERQEIDMEVDGDMSLTVRFIE